MRTNEDICIVAHACIPSPKSWREMMGGYWPASLVISDLQVQRKCCVKYLVDISDGRCEYLDATCTCTAVHIIQTGLDSHYILQYSLQYSSWKFILLVDEQNFCIFAYVKHGSIQIMIIFIWLDVCCKKVKSIFKRLLM